ncbi:hypothetical protein EXN66_Car013715 [Channa argus]|uniref:Uncharacterized protein n=1 Tax=Channa argus TaxID=215402 RepID=A0A6G1Q6K6_CHAAH|nr:hypothetical protein EXN66_Car013715 [Channa argus]
MRLKIPLQWFNSSVCQRADFSLSLNLLVHEAVFLKHDETERRPTSDQINQDQQDSVWRTPFLSEHQFKT